MADTRTSAEVTCRCIPEMAARECIEGRWKRNYWGTPPEGRTCTCPCHEPVTPLPTAAGGRDDG